MNIYVRDIIYNMLNIMESDLLYIYGPYIVNYNERHYIQCKIYK